MTLIHWTDEMSVGVKAMDDDHKKLIGILNEMKSSLESADDLKAFGVALEQLVEYTRIHLAREEKLLAYANYPESTEHHKEHDEMIDKALKAQANFRCGATDMLAAEMTDFLQDWLMNHILISDKMYGPHLNEHGIS